MVNGADGIDADSSTTPFTPLPVSTNEVGVSTSERDVELIENTNSHHVEPHWRTLPEGSTIWVDGDGDTSVHTN